MTVPTPGELSPEGNLYGFLRDRVFGDVLGLYGYPLTVRLTPLEPTGSVWRCDDQFTCVTIVLKFYGKKWVNGQQSGMPGLRAELMRREYNNLARVRQLGFDSIPHRVVRPLATDEALDCLLVEDFVRGHDLAWYLERAVVSGFVDDLSARIADVAWFLADLHDRSQDNSPLDPATAIAQLEEYFGELEYWRIISIEQQRRLEELARRWRASGLLANGSRALIHGDATPTQFLFPFDHDLTVIDLEHLCLGDTAADIGFLAAELKHHFLWHTGHRLESEPYIRQLYDDYVRYSRAATLSAEFTERGRFFMGCAELRMARNPWLDLEYRRRLVDEALECLRI